MDLKQLWQSVLVEMELDVSKANFSTWFKDTRLVKEDGGVAVLSVPNAFVKEWLLTKYHSAILRNLRNLENSIHAVEYVVNKEEARRREERPGKDTNTRELPLTEAAAITLKKSGVAAVFQPGASLEAIVEFIRQAMPAVAG